MSCFNEFALTVQVKHEIKSTQIPGFILIWLYFTTGHCHSTHVNFAKNVAYIAFNSWLSFQRLCRLLWGFSCKQASRSFTTVFCKDCTSPTRPQWTGWKERRWKHLPNDKLHWALRVDPVTPNVNYSVADRGAEYWDERVCVCLCVFVCPRSHLCNYTSDLRQTFMHVTYGRRSVLLCRRYDMYFRFYGQIDR